MPACLVYMDDVISVGHIFQNNFNNLWKVFQRLQEAHLKLNSEKSKIFQKEVRYFGHTESSKGVTTDPEKLEAVKCWPPQTDKHQLRRLLRLCTYYRRFILGFSDITKLLKLLTQQKQTFQWSPQAKATFQSLKASLCTIPILRYPQPGENLIDTNTSSFDIG
jgi:hypothetical protein